MEVKFIIQDLEAAMRQLCEIKNRLRKVAAMLTPEQERQPDLFSDMGLTKEPLEEKIKRATESWKGVDVDKFMADVRGTEPEEPETDVPAEPQRRTWKKLTVQMKDTAIVAAEKVGRKSGWCQRSDIERSIVRKTGRSREDVRKALNYVLERGQFTCIKSRSYRYYRTNLRDFLIAETTRELGA